MGRFPMGFYSLPASKYYSSVTLLISRQAAQDMLALNWKLNVGEKALQIDNAVSAACLARKIPVLTYLPHPVKHTGMKSTMTSHSNLQSVCLMPDLENE
jgi:hypothetical protein